MTERVEAGARSGDRGPLDLRAVEIVAGWVPAPLGSALIRQGATWVLCAVSLEERPPAWRRGSGRGWLTASYAMLPGSTSDRKERERRGAGGRTLEIERLIGRSLRGAVDLAALPEWTLHVDCDVLQADGGTRTAAVTAGWVALARALRRLESEGRLGAATLVRQVTAVSVGVVDGDVLLDLDYAEDVRAETDMNVVATDDGDLLEAQATAERRPFSPDQLAAMVDAATKGASALAVAQREALDAGS